MIKGGEKYLKKTIITAFGFAVLASAGIVAPTFAHGRNHIRFNGQTMEQHIETRLSKLVADKKITPAQKTLIENKLKELAQEHKADKDKIKGMTRAQRLELHKQEKTNLENWAKQNGIDLQILLVGKGKRMGMWNAQK